IDIVDDDAVPPAEGRRPDTDVDDDIQKRALRGEDELRLTRRDERVVHAADHAPSRDRQVPLLKPKRVADRLLQPVGTVELEEETAVVAMLDGSELVGVRDRQLSHLHPPSLRTRAPD